ncbi:hypothetical protein NIES592_19100 [Fischerella major NIES-592]|uniref:Uncharacterized protein n=1 Tax=Fischerella major NIES-592 TaxID=210994 RepID=A0A1U7GVC6_9CYAN|nr:hypothetical protein [Fischerella major]OKH12040.1 hypothetical protein NIES592_19100 [Fischerella major NIES-592]
MGIVIELKPRQNLCYGNRLPMQGDVDTPKGGFPQGTGIDYALVASELARLLYWVEQFGQLC